MFNTGTIKAIILGILFLFSLFFPSIITPSKPLLQIILVPLIFPSVVLPIFSRIRFRTSGVRPLNWNDNPLDLKNDLSMDHFFAYFFMTQGIANQVGSYINFDTLSKFGFMMFSFGLGLLISIYITFKVVKVQSD